MFSMLSKPRLDFIVYMVDSESTCKQNLLNMIRGALPTSLPYIPES